MVQQGATQQQIADTLGVDDSTVSRYLAKNRERAEAMNAESQAIAAENVLRDIAGATQARMDDAKDTGSRTGPQSYLAALQGAGVIQKGGTSVHVGDNYSTTNVLDQSEHQHLHVGPAGERRQKRGGLRRDLGLE